MRSNAAAKEVRNAVLSKWGSEVIGIALFGSFVRGKEYKDIDVLVVLEAIKKSRMQRIKDIVEIKRALDFPTDVLLVSREECQDNFRSHNPLFLDIASEGKVIYDKGFLKELMHEITVELHKNRIKKKASMWMFPVKDRTPTPLSDITNRDWARYWLQDSTRDLMAAEYLFKERLHEKAVYHCQQSVEKAIKAVLICFGIYEKTHYVATILRREVKTRRMKEYAGKLEEMIGIAEELEPHVSFSRYPGVSKGEVWLPSKEYTCEMAEDALQNAQKAVKIGKDFVKWWFKSKQQS